MYVKCGCVVGVSTSKVALVVSKYEKPHCDSTVSKLNTVLYYVILYYYVYTIQ